MQLHTRMIYACFVYTQRILILENGVINFQLPYVTFFITLLNNIALETNNAARLLPCNILIINQHSLRIMTALERQFNNAINYTFESRAIKQICLRNVF